MPFWWGLNSERKRGLTIHVMLIPAVHKRVPCSTHVPHYRAPGAVPISGVQYQGVNRAVCVFASTFHAFHCCFVSRSVLTRRRLQWRRKPRVPAALQGVQIGGVGGHMCFSRTASEVGWSGGRGGMGEADRFCLRLSADGPAGTKEGVPLPLVGGIPRLRDKRPVPPSRGGEAPWLRPSGGVLNTSSLPFFARISSGCAPSGTLVRCLLVGFCSCGGSALRDLLSFRPHRTSRASRSVGRCRGTSAVLVDRPLLAAAAAAACSRLLVVRSGRSPRGGSDLFAIFLFSRPTPIPFFAHGLSASFARFLAKPCCCPVIGGFPVLLLLRFAS